jgi:eukaryotic-like serine/threonine-protein kinase
LPDLLPRLQTTLADTYHLERELGRGGMAVVYLAQDLRHDRPVALKVLHPELAASLGTERFLREIKLAARLQHPHILSVHDSGQVQTEGGQGPSYLWFTMPYIEGESLRERLSHEHQLPVEEALRLTREIALALDFAHRHGVVHRDIKPENILLVDGQALVADFGIGRALGAPAAVDRLTGTGIVMGTPTYMSPEQAAGERDVDGRTDVYSLGVVLYEMLAGEPPFTGSSAQSIAAKRLTGEVPSLRRIRPLVSEDLERCVVKALAPIPADRFSTPGQLAQELGASVTPTGSRPATPPAGTTYPTAASPAAAARRWIPNVPTWLVLLLGIMVSATAGTYLWQRSKQAPQGPGLKMLAVLPFKNLGQAGDQYFADGLTEEITSRLSGVSELGVVSRTSADQYRNSSKSLKQIGQELGVGYILEGSVRWEKSQDGTSRVRVTPQLIRVTDDRHLWADRYDARLAEVFQVQSGIAEQVVAAMNLALDEPERQVLQSHPTANTDAYDAYLRGIAYRDRGPGQDDIRLAKEMFRQAVQLDSNFAQAWAKLSEIESSEFWFFYDRSEAALARAKAAADRALRLRPDLPEPHVALAYYHYWGRLDYDAALRELAIARERQPNNAALMFATAAVQRRQGRWPEAVASFQETVRRDPRSSDAAFNLGETYFLLRQYDLALRTFDRTITLVPDRPFCYWAKAHTLLAKGASLDEVKQTLSAAVARVDFMTLARTAAGTSSVAGFAVSPSFLLTTDTSHHRNIERLTLPEFNDSVGYYTLKAEMYRAQRRSKLEATYLDSARAILESQVRALPDEGSFHAQVGIVYAYMGRTNDAIREGETAVRLLPVSKEAYRGANLVTALALIYATAGRRAEALDRLEYLMSVPAQISRPVLRSDPRWAPLRGDPRFERLTSGS